MPPILVEATIRLGYAIFAVATLTFIGFGLQPPSADWAVQISDNYPPLISSGGRCSSRRWRSRRSWSRSISSPTACSRCSSDERAERCALDELDVRYRVRGLDRRVLRGVSLQIGPGQSYGLVGESGCGKSTVALAIVRYLPRNGRVSAGSISVAGRDVLALRGRALREYRARTVSMVYQNPGAALNPSIRVGSQVAEAFTVLGVPPREADERAQSRAARVQIADPGSVMRRYPHQLSGGMQQRARHRDGARQGSRAPDPRRADDRARRDGRGRGARSRAAAPSRASDVGPLHQPQPRRHREDVLAGRRPLRGQARRGGSGRARSCRILGIRTRSGCSAASRAEASARTMAGWTRSRAFCPVWARSSPGCVFAERCALADERCHTEEPPLLAVSARPREPVLVPRTRRRPSMGGGGRPRAATRRPRGPAARGARRAHEGLRAARTATCTRSLDISASIWPGRRSGSWASPAAARRRSHERCSGSWRRRRGGRARRKASPAALPEPLAVGAARAADRVSEPGLSAQPPTLGATHPASLAEKLAGHRDAPPGSA